MEKNTTKPAAPKKPVAKKTTIKASEVEGSKGVTSTHLEEETSIPKRFLLGQIELKIIQKGLAAISEDNSENIQFWRACVAIQEKIANQAVILNK